MLIACEKCATTYVLDERLIPAAGAPVQCTRCSHVFTAKPGAAAPASLGRDTPQPRSTMMFGKGVEQPANQTKIYGAAGGSIANPPLAPVPRTMMFGAPAVDAQKAAPNNATLVFGGVPAATAAPPAEGAPANQTMMFGAGAAAPPAQAPVTTTTRPTAQTMVFGSAAVLRPPSGPLGTGNNRSTSNPPPGESAPGAGNTMIFGTTETASDPGKPNEKTVRIGPDDLERMMKEHTAKADRGREPVVQKTQMFAMTDLRPRDERSEAGGAPAPQSADQPLAQQNRTAMFAMSPEAPSGDAKPTSDNWASLPLLARIQTTDGSAIGPNTPLSLPLLSPHDSALSEGLDAASEDLPASAEDAARALAQQVKGRNRLALVMVALLIVGAAAALGWKLFGSKVFGKSVPLEAMQGVESGLSELRKDDTASKAAAVKLLSAVVKAQPTFVDAHAGLVTALTLQLDDLQQRAKRLDRAAEERNVRISRYNKEKTPGDWERRAAGLVAEVQALKKAYDPLVARARELEGRLRDAYKAMQGAVSQAGALNRRAELALIRAQALYHAYGGTDEALKLTKRYQSKADGTSDGWIDLVDAEYAANTRASPELIDAAQKQLTLLHERDPTFFRTYVLAARLKLQAKLYDEAEAELQTVSALKPQHDIANELSAWVKKVKAEQAAKEKDRSP